MLTRCVKRPARGSERLPERLAAAMARCLRAAALGALAAACGGAQPSPLDAAEAACELEIRSVIQSGECDRHEQLNACPAYILTQAHCWRLLTEAEREP